MDLCRTDGYRGISWDGARLRGVGKDIPGLQDTGHTALGGWLRVGTGDDVGAEWERFQNTYRIPFPADMLPREVLMVSEST